MLGGLGGPVVTTVRVKVPGAYSYPLPSLSLSVYPLGVHSEDLILVCRGFFVCEDLACLVPVTLLFTESGVGYLIMYIGAYLE